MERTIELLAEKAVRRIEREAKFITKSGLPAVHAHAVRAAQDRLEADTASAVLHQRLHNRINELCVLAGIIRKVGCTMVPA